MAVNVINRYRFNTGITVLTIFGTETELKGIKVNFSDNLDIDGIFLTKSNKLIEAAIKELGEFFDGKKKDLDLGKYEYSSKEVKKVSEEVKKVKFGKTVTLKDLATKVKMSEKEVEKILLNNQFPLVVPCHRVVKNTKNVGSYVGGEEVKKALLEFEKNN